VRVHPEFLKAQKLPAALVGKNIWKERFEDINAVERYLVRNGVAIRKFFLHISPEEQKKRFLERLDNPEKNWKFSMADVGERGRWNDYMAAYEDMIRNTSTEHAPWYAVPANNKWFTRLVVAGAVIDAMQDLDLAYPKLDAAKLEELQHARSALEASGKPAKSKG
jgi:polyphosphate kinase 2 (PPK2 family)